MPPISDAGFLTMKEDIIEEYNKLKTKYKLPDFEALDLEFDISSIDNDSFLLKSILTKGVNKLDEYVKLLNNVMSPDTASLVGMHECRIFEDNEKRDLYSLLRKIMISIRKGDLLILNYNEKESADFIKKLVNDWNEIKKELTKALNKLVESWVDETDVKEEIGYLG